MAGHNTLGTEGERMACEFLITQGYIIRETNWRLNHLEIDIVAERPGEGLLHIVEVKSRSDDAHFDPMRAINRKKIMNLVNAANGYVRHYRLHMGVQFDVVLVVGRQGNTRLAFYPNAFRPPLRTY